MNDLVIAGGLVVSSEGRCRAHIVVNGGRIAALLDASHGAPEAAQVLDASGKVVIPGGIDGHCHVAQVTGRYRTLDDFAVTSTAALWGGTTTIFDFGIPRDDSESPLAAVLNKLALAEQSRCDVGLHGAVVTWDDSVPRQLDDLADLGVRSTKLYMTNRGTTMADHDTVLRVMREMVRLDGLTYIHAEHDAIVVASTEHHARAGQLAVNHLHRIRPNLVEEASVDEVLAMSEFTGAPVYLVHQSTGRAVDLVSSAQARGLDVVSETCPHYVLLDDRVYGGDVPERYSCCPPMRSAETVAALRQRLRSGGIDTVSSDHSCYDLSQKREHADDVRAMPHGLPGVETRMPATFTALLSTFDEDALATPGLLERFVDVFATAPARINAVPAKGVLAPGYDADIVVFDPAEVRTVAGSQLHMGTDHSPFDGLVLRGWPQVVVSAGRVVLDDAGFHDPGPVGRRIRQGGYRESAGRLTRSTTAVLVRQ